MSEPIKSTNKDDIHSVNTLRVTCDGTGRGGHPKVFLTMVDDKNGKPTQVVCPYCSKVFKYEHTKA